MGTSENVSLWSTTAASNDTADAGINWAEGQAANTVNNSARGMMAGIAKWKRDKEGALTTGGSANAQTLTTSTGLTALADGIEIGFVAGYTNSTTTPTLNVDSLGAKKMRKVDTTGEVALAAGDVTAAGHYIARYDASADSASGAWIILNPASVSNVTNANLAQMANATVKARITSGTGAPEDATITQVMDLVAGTAAQGDILYRGSSAMARLAAGTANYVLATKGAGQNPDWLRILGTQTIWVPASAMISRTTNGAASGSVETSTNKVMIKTLDFDASTAEYAQFSVAMPKSWNNGTVTAQFLWSHASTTTNFAVIWGLQGLALSDDDAGDAAFGTAQTVTDTGGTTNDFYWSGATSAITIGNTPASGDVVVFQVYRDASNGSDTLAVDARLHGVKLFYTTSAATDD